MACRGWLLVVGISCLILASQGINISAIVTTTPTSTSTSTSQGTPKKQSTILGASSQTTTQESMSSTTQTTAQESTSSNTQAQAAASLPRTTAEPAATSPVPPSPTATTTTTTPTNTSTTTTPTTTPTTPTNTSTTTTTTTATAATTAATTAAATTSLNGSIAISSTTSGTTLSTNNSTNSSTPASITSNTEPTSSESQTSREASSATAETSTPSSTVSTASPVATTVQPTTTSLAATSPSPPKPNLLINEFTYNGLFSKSKTFNVEIRRLEGDATPNMTVMVSDLKMKCAAVVQVDSAAWNNNLATFETAPLTPANRSAVIVSLYTFVQWTSCTDVNMTGVEPLDATIVSQVPVNTTTTSIQFVPDYLSRILIAQVSKSIPQGANLSVVRCDDTRLDPGSFIIAPSTFNQSNSCDLVLDVALKTITLNYTCDQWKDENTRKLINYFVREVGSRCRCGFSPVYIQNATVNCTHTTTTTISWSISKGFESEYDNVVNATNCMENVTPNELCLARTCHNCNNSKRLDPKHKGNISVTVGVVIACIVVFLVIVAIVILYIRKKRRGILQFRMTRLDEDDDDLMMSNDADDFVGGQEASFSNSSYTRFK